jgi:hypothetical protein
MGYCVFTLVFSDGMRQPYIGGNAIDFVSLPAGMTADDIVDVLPHQGRDDNPRATADYSWCLYGSGEGGMAHCDSSNNRLQRTIMNKVP